MAVEYISKAWKIYKKNYLSFIGSELILSIVTTSLIILGLVIFLGSVLPGLDWNLITSIEDENVLMQYFMELFSKPEFLSSLGIGALGFGIFIVLTVLVSLYINIGQVGMAYESLKKRTRIRTMFKASRKFGFRWIATSLLLFVICLIALIPILVIGVLTLGLGFIAVFLVIPIIILIGPAMVIDNASPVESIKKAFNVAKRNYLNLFALFLIYAVGMFLISFLGGLLSFIPLVGGLIDLCASLFIGFAIAPMMKISFVDYYVKNRKGSRKGI
ncbi:MAG: hypothetical protein ISS48_01575 [Candidatus Aenigmarchaeota archaeon]|nr:hypothetical protein [Candidatus Aenigmarchaeota archaeon]